MSNIVDELWLLTEWYFINRMTYYILQGRVQASIRIGGQLCYSFVANLLQYLCAKNYKNSLQCRWTKSLQKIKGAIFLSHSIVSVSITHVRLDAGDRWTGWLFDSLGSAWSFGCLPTSLTNNTINKYLKINISQYIRDNVLNVTKTRIDLGVIYYHRRFKPRVPSILSLPRLINVLMP